MTPQVTPGPDPAALRRYVAGLRRAPSGPAVAALFDFDGTLIAGYSVFAFLQQKFLGRAMRRGEVADTARSILRYALGQADFAELMETGARHARGVAESEYLALGEQLFERHLARRIFPEARAIIDAHRRRGHTLAIVTSATRYQVERAARELGIDTVLASRYRTRKGAFTGEIEPPLCFGEGKLRAAASLASRAGIDLRRSYFYSDSPDDLALLEGVGRPRVVNPGARLEALAGERGWPVLRFASRPRPKPVDYLRGLSPYPTLAGSIAASLPILALTRSARETANFALGTFGDVASAIAGVTLDVRGEANLWRSRPCVFVFNHQSNADVFIVAKLVRSDMTGIGKQELRSVPVLGRLMEMGGMVFVDRHRTASAIEAMAPLVDALRRDRKSVCIAPEGTRSSTGQLGPFKKGAFHLAIQARVPVVPIVIHNSADVQAKHELAMRPARVRVDVLPPIDTSSWRPSTLERHVREVRQSFLDRLGQA